VSHFLKFVQANYLEAYQFKCSSIVFYAIPRKLSPTAECFVTDVWALCNAIAI